MDRAYRTRADNASRTPAKPAAGAKDLIIDRLEQLAREGAEKLLAEMLEMEVTEFLGRVRYERGQSFPEGRGYRNGYANERKIGVGLGAVSVRVPRVSEVPREVAPDGFESQIVGRYQRLSRTTQRPSRKDGPALPGGSVDG